jgi:hypothetical protein
MLVIGRFLAQSFPMRAIKRGLSLKRLIGLAAGLSLLAGPHAFAEPRPTITSDPEQISELGIIGPLITTGSGANQRLVNLKTGLPSGSRGPLQNSAVPMALGAEVIVLQGERGAMGNIGPVGQQGPAGAPGIRGSNGLNGSAGAAGAAGQAGSDGLDAFNLWKLETSQPNASLSEFFAQFRGSDGSNGANGANGKDAEFPEGSMTGLVQTLIPNSEASCGPGEYQVAVKNLWGQTALNAEVECRSLLATAPAPIAQSFGLNFANQFGFQAAVFDQAQARNCDVGQMFGALTLDGNGALLVECIPSEYASNSMALAQTLPAPSEGDLFQRCGAQSFVGGLGFNDQNQLVMGCVDLDLTAEQSPIQISSQQCNDNPNSAPKVMVGLNVETALDGKKIVTIKCAPLVSMDNPSSSNNGNNQNSDPDGNSGSNQGNNGNNNDSAPGGNNGQGQGQRNLIELDESEDDSDSEPEESASDSEESESDPSQDDSDNGSVVVEIEEVEQEEQEQFDFEFGMQGPSSLQGEKGDKGDKGDKGEVGLSAYQIWLNLGNSGSESEFIEALTVTSPAAQGIAGPQGPSGLNGLSAFEIWRSQDGSRSQATISDFLMSLKGEKGDRGLSAFEVWKADSNQRANATNEDFFESLRGPQGPAGLSAFEIWKQAEPNTRRNATEKDFLDSLNGIPAGWVEQVACLDNKGVLSLKKCSPSDKTSTELTILIKAG